MNSKRIMFVGPSGIGKTTLAKWVSETQGIPFISGSRSDLLHTSETHKDLLMKDSEDLYKSDFQLLTMRNNLFKDKTHFVTDRSYADLAAYFWYKQSKHMPDCEIEHFICLCKTLMEKQCDIAVFLSLNLDNYKDWVIEDNNKRITNRFFQIQISTMMEDLLIDWKIPTLHISDLDISHRKDMIGDIL